MKYMTLAGMAIARVGERPRHRDERPSCREIFRKPSRVEVKVLWRAVSTTQSAAVPEADELEGDIERLRAVLVAEGEALAIQKGEVLLTQKTSLQQAVTPMFGGRFANDGNLFGRLKGLSADCFEVGD